MPNTNLSNKLQAKSQVLNLHTNFPAFRNAVDWYTNKIAYFKLHTTAVFNF